MLFAKRLKENRGQAVVETAIVLPVILLLLFAILEFGQVLNEYLVLTAAAREGARTAAVSDDTAARAAVNEAVTNIRKTGLQITIEYPGGLRQQGKPVAVTVTKPVEVSTPMIKELIEPELLITGKSVMRVEMP